MYKKEIQNNLENEPFSNKNADQLKTCMVCHVRTVHTQSTSVSSVISKRQPATFYALLQMHLAHLAPNTG